MPENATLMQIDTTDAINNTDTLHLVSLCDGIILQCARSPSASTHETRKQDLDIMTGWLDHFSGMFDHFSAQPETYMPHASPKPTAVPVPPTVYRVENAGVQGFMDGVSRMRTELLLSESAQRMNGFSSSFHDVVISPWIEKMRAYLGKLVEDLAPENAGHTWLPEVNEQPEPVNVGNPR